MTVVIGIKSKEGAVLVADSMITRGENSFQGRKMDHAIHSDGEHLSGVYLAWSGSYQPEFDANPLFNAWVRRRKNQADKLTDPYVLGHTLTEMNERMAEIRDELDKSRYSPNPNDGDLIEEKDMFDDLINVRAFIEQNTGGQRYWSGLRLSDNFSPDLVHVADAEVKNVLDYIAHGTGKEFVMPTLQKHFSEGMSLDEATELAVKAMNVALQKEDQFKGYDLVRAKKLPSGQNLVQTASDHLATKVNDLQYVGPNFW